MGSGFHCLRSFPFFLFFGLIFGGVLGRAAMSGFGSVVRFGRGMHRCKVKAITKMIKSWKKPHVASSGVLTEPRNKDNFY